MQLRPWRKREKISQTALAAAIGLKSHAQIADFESGRQRLSAENAIAIDRLTSGEVPVRELRPDLHDVRVIRAPEAGVSA